MAQYRGVVMPSGSPEHWRISEVEEYRQGVVLTRVRVRK